MGTPTFFQHILNTQTDKPSIGDDQSHHLSIHFTKNQTEPSISLKDSFSYEYRSSHLTQNLEPSLFTIQEDPNTLDSVTLQVTSTGGGADVNISNE